MSLPPEPVVCALYTTEAKDLPMVSVDEVSAVAGRGLVGDRYYNKTGFYSNIVGWGAQVTLIQDEAIQAVNVGHSTAFTGSMLRRNIVTRNIKLDLLIGKTFSCGTAILRGTKLFPPCTHLAQLLGKPQVLRYFAYCGGIGAEVIAGGEIKTHDRITIIQSQTPSNANGTGIG